MRRKSERTSSTRSTSSRRGRQIAEANTEEEQKSKQPEEESTNEKVSEKETGVEVENTALTKTSTQPSKDSSSGEESVKEVRTRRSSTKAQATKMARRQEHSQKIKTIPEENGEMSTEVIPTPVEDKVTDNIAVVQKPCENQPQTSTYQSDIQLNENEDVNKKEHHADELSQKSEETSIKKSSNIEISVEVIKKPARKSRFDEKPKELEQEKLPIEKSLQEQTKIEVPKQQKDRTRSESNKSTELRIEKTKEQRIEKVSKFDKDQKTEKDHKPEKEPIIDRGRKIEKDSKFQKESKILKPENDKDQSTESEKIENGTANDNYSQEKVNEKPQRKRKWLSNKSISEQQPVLAISTDSLKELISDIVHPVPLSDVKLDSSPEHEEVSIVIDEKTLAVVNCDDEDEKREPISPKRPRSREHSERNNRKSSSSRDRIPIEETPKNTEKPTIGTNRKISIVDKPRPPSPSKNLSSSILYITNLVRPFTVLQLKSLLQRTGKIVEENGFWIDRIKSKCFVRYETEDEAIETRHALHGVRWPTSNPKCLNVDFGSEVAMEKAITSTLEDQPKNRDIGKDNRIIGTGWDKERFDYDREKRDLQVNRPVREWDVGKKEEFDRDSEKNRSSRNERIIGRNGERDEHRDRDRGRNRDDRNRERRYSSDRENVRDLRRSASCSPVRKYKKKDDPPLRLLDDLFRKTKTTPCVYWLPLTPEQIAEKEKARQKRIEERQKIRQERDRNDRERREKRSRSRNRRY